MPLHVGGELWDGRGRLAGTQRLPGERRFFFNFFLGIWAFVFGIVSGHSVVVTDINLGLLPDAVKLKKRQTAWMMPPPPSDLTVRRTAGVVRARETGDDDERGRERE